MRQRSNLIILFGIAFFLVGAVIVFLVLNDDDDGSSASVAPGQAQIQVLVAGADIPAGTVGTDVIAEGLLSTETVPAGSQPVGAITSAVELDNKIFAVPVGEGSVITAAQLSVRSLSNIQVPEGFDGVAVTIDYTAGGAGYIAPGDRVNVYGQYALGEGAGDAGFSAAAVGAPLPAPRTELVLTNVLVLDVSAQQGTSIETTDANGNQTLGRQPLATPLTYLLALTPTDAERVMQLTSFARLYFSLTADEAPNVADTPGVSGENVNGPVSADSAAPQS